METDKNTMGSSATGSAPASEAGSAGGSSPPSPAISLKEWQKPLAEHQTRVLRTERVMLSACHTGSGKTYIATQTVKDLGMRTLVVCPKIAITQWKNIIAGMGASPFVVDVVNPEKLVASRNNPYYSDDGGWRFGNAQPADGGMLLVVDEIHRGCSGIDSKQTLMVARWCNKFHPGNKVLAMSATPFETPLKLRALGYLMGFHKFVKNSFYDWMRAHGCGMVNIGRGRNRRQVFEFTRDRKKAEEIMRVIRHDMGDRFMSVGPDEIPGFPDEVKEVVLVDLAKRDHDALVKAYSEMPERIQHMSEDDMVKMLRLRQQAEFCKAETMAQMACDLVEDGNSVFVMVNFTDARTRIEEYLKAKGLKYASIYGGQKEIERQEGIDAFQSNRVHVIIGMAAACSVALSLHDERHERPRVSLISPGYSASEFSQGLGRIRRVGGTTAVQKIVIAAGSVEERVGRAIERKMNNLSALTDRDLMRK